MAKAQHALKVRIVKYSTLVHAPYNPREMSEAARAGLRTSIKRFGVVEFPVINERTGFIVGGNQRVEQALEIDPEYEGPAVYGSWDEVEEKALNVTLNNPEIQGHFTPGTLELLRDLEQRLPEAFAALRLGDVERHIKDGIAAVAERVKDQVSRETRHTSFSAPVISSVVVWDNEAQKTRWQAFAAWVKSRYPDAATLGAGLASFLADHPDYLGE